MTQSLTRALVLLLGLALPVSGQQPAQTGDDDLASGIRQVREGDFEVAIVTLEGVARRLEADGGRPRAAAEARLFLGVAQVALGQLDAARASFRAALVSYPDLTASEAQFSPKVIRVFDQARAELHPQRRSKGSKTPIVVAGVVGAAAATVAIIAASGSSGDSPGSSQQPAPSGTVGFDNARFSAPVLLCEDGSVDVALPFAILVDADNPASSALTVRSVAVQMAIVDSPSEPSEVGFTSIRSATATPSSVPARTGPSVRVESTLLCSNGRGDPERYNDWVGLVTLETSAGTFSVETQDRVRVNLP